MIALSHGEWRALVVKAGRGAGLDWGLAEELGWAAEWLSRRGLPAPIWLSDWFGGSSGTCPLRFGVALADGAATTELPDDLRVPGLLLPFLSRLGEVEVSAAQHLVVQISAEGVHFGPLWSDGPRGWRLASPSPAPRPAISSGFLTELERLAMLTNVPASSISRQGAGASGGDND